MAAAACRRRVALLCAVALSLAGAAGHGGGDGRCRFPKCPFIYVYDSPPLNALLMRQLDAGFDRKINIDMIVHKALLDSGCTVSDPSQASFFFVPYYSSSNHRDPDGPHPLCTLISYLQTDWRDHVYWSRNAQRDHALVMARIADWYAFERLVERTRTRLTLHPIESIRARNHTLPLPYPVHAEASKRQLIVDPRKRTPGTAPLGLAFFAGSSVLNSMSGNHSTVMRTNLKSAMDAEGSNSLFIETGRAGGTTHNVVNKVWKDAKAANAIIDYSSGYFFCPVPPGDSSSSARFFDSFWRLCIPVLFGHGWQLPFSRVIPYDKIVVTMPAALLETRTGAELALSQLRHMSIDERVRRRQLMLNVRHLFEMHYVGNQPSGVKMLIRMYAHRALDACRHRRSAAGRRREGVHWDELLNDTRCATRRSPTSHAQ